MSFQRLPHEKTARALAYRMGHGVPGHDGEPPELVSPRDDPANNNKRELPERENANCDRITYLKNRKHISARQHEAGKRLAKDWHLSLIQPVASVVMVGACGGSSVLPCDAKVDAMRRHGSARDALGCNWPIVELVVQDELSVEKAAARLRVHRQVAFGMLWASLHLLADHYGIGGEKPSQRVHPFV